MRPVLLHSAHRLWRDPQTLQLGTVGGQVLAGLDSTARSVLTLLDGSRDLAGVVADAERAGCPAARAREVVTLLLEGGLLCDADAPWPRGTSPEDRDRLAADVVSLGLLHRGAGLAALGRRDRAQVLVLGAGRLGAPVASLLAASGVGTVDVCDDGITRPRDTAPGGLSPAHVGRNRGQAARDALQEHYPTTRTGPAGDPDLVVLVPAGSLDEPAVQALVRGGVPHLLAEVRETVGVVGPLVVPGRTACLTCLDHARTDRDPQWPVLAAQLVAAPRQVRSCDSALAAAVAAQTVLQALAALDGDSPATVDGSLELALPDWRWRRRSWVRHAACACRWEEAV